MRVLTSSVLIMEAIVVGLAIPVALVVADAPAWGAALLGLLAVVCLLLPGAFRRHWFVAAGWTVQGLVLATAVIVPMMLVLGAVFLVLWWIAVRLGRRADAARPA